MAKKVKKRSTNAPTAVVAKTETATPKAAASRTPTAEFNPDYSYVKKDLKRIGILAGSFFVVLVVLSFFLR
jgi:hypothetical protein